MPPLSMIALRDRFTPNPVLPSAIVEQQNHWRERWGMRPRSPGPGEDWRYYFDPSEVQAENPNDPRQRLRYAILKGQRDTKYFLTGSKGAGKSTTAYALWDDPEVNERYTVLGFTVHDYLNPAETDASQVIAVMIAHIVEMLRDAEQDAELGDLRARGATEALEVVFERVKPGRRFQPFGVGVFGRFTAMFEHSASARARFRDFTDGRFDEIVAIFDELNGLLEGRTGKETLFVVDGLDEIVGDELRWMIFHVQLPMLLRPSCAALYGYPLEIDHDPRFDSLERGQLDRHVLANVQLVERVGGPMLAEGREVMTHVLQRLDRMELADVVTLSASEWDRVLRYSAGNFGELARLLCHAFEIAGMTGKDRADRRCFELALGRVREGYGMFVQKHRGFLRMVGDGERASAELLPRVLSKSLAARAVMEYPGEPWWLGLNPVVADLLEGSRSMI